MLQVPPTHSLFFGVYYEEAKGGRVTPILSKDEQRDFLKRGFSRRNFGRLATMLTAGATLPFDCLMAEPHDRSYALQFIHIE